MMELGQIHGEGHLHPDLSHPLEEIMALAWSHKTTPDRILDMDADLFTLWLAYCRGRGRGESARWEHR